jgi:hypothetical protein
MADELNKPSRGTGDWDIPINDNFDTLEAAARAFLPRGTTQTLNVADVSSDNINNSATITSESVDPKFISETYVYAGNFNGSTPSDRLQNALSSSSGGRIYLEPQTYNNPVTVNTRKASLIGSRDCDFQAILTIDADEVLVKDFTVNRFGGGEIVVQGIDCGVESTLAAEITLTSNTSDCVVIGNIASAITDNGTGNQIIGNR